MTRLRNVGGTITKTTVGDHKIYSEGNIVQNAGGTIIETGKEKGVNFGKPKSPPIIEIQDFDLEFSLDRVNNTIVPFGIFDFNDKYENPYFNFKYTLSKADVDHLNFEIFDENGKVIYQMAYLQAIVVKAESNPLIFNGITEKKKDATYKTIDFASIYLQYVLQETRLYKNRELYYTLGWF